MSGGPGDTGPQVVVTITMREVYDAVLTLTGQVNASISRQEDTARDVADHETRLRALERARWPLPSLAALLSLAAVVFAALAYFNHNP